jgi:glutamate synthase (NADPH/NADH) large chain
VFLRGQVGERFCVRNSGAIAVVEGVGDHACEYMTGGVVVVLGPTGRNFAAGMSGGLAYVWDPEQKLGRRLNKNGVELEELDDEDAAVVTALVEKHRLLTASQVAGRMLNRWALAGGSTGSGIGGAGEGTGGADEVAGGEGGPKREFVKVMPSDYKRVLEATRRAIDEGSSVEDAVMAAAHD